jgi:hypothetical protein
VALFKTDYEGRRLQPTPAGHPQLATPRASYFLLVMILCIEGLKIKFFIPRISLLKGSLFRGFNVLFAFTVHVLNSESKFVKIFFNEFLSFVMSSNLGCKLLPCPHEIMRLREQHDFSHVTSWHHRLPGRHLFPVLEQISKIPKVIFPITSKRCVMKNFKVLQHSY